MRYISTLDMRFSRQGFLIVFFIFILAGVASGTVLERVVAIIEDSPVFLSEFLEFKKHSLSLDKPVLSDEEILDKLINRKLLLMEAHRLRLDTVGGEKKNPDTLINRYLDITVRTFIPHSLAKNKRVQPKDDEFNRRLKKKIAELRKQYDIRIYPEM